MWLLYKLFTHIQSNVEYHCFQNSVVRGVGQGPRRAGRLIFELHSSSYMTRTSGMYVDGHTPEAEDLFLAPAANLPGVVVARVSP